MSDQIFQVNSASVKAVVVSSSLSAVLGSTIDFTQAAIVTGSFSGSFIGRGDNLTNVSASYIIPTENTTASYALTASMALNVPATASHATFAESASNAQSASYIIPGASFHIVSGSDGVPPSYIEIYDMPTGSYVPPFKEGRMWYDGQYHNMDYYTDDSGFRAQLCKELIIGVHNPSGSTLPRLTVVYVSGSTGTLPDVYPAMADGSGTKSKIIGVVRSNIASSSNGYMLTRGVMHRSNMAGYDVGTALWLSPTIPGGLTATRPGQPYEEVLVGYCSEAGPLGSFVCAIQDYPIPANAYAGMTSIPSIQDSLDSGSADFTQSLYIGAATVNLYANTSGIGAILGYPILPATVSVPVGGNVVYVYAKLDGTTASYATTTDFSSINQTTKVPVAISYRADVDAHWVSTNQEGLALANKLNQRLEATERFTRENGLVLDASGSYITVTEGNVWVGATRFTEHAFDSRLTGSDFQSGSFNELHFAYHSASVWIAPVSTDGTYNTNYYDDGTNLVPLGPLSYSVDYMFRIFGENNEYDEDVFYLASNNQYNSVQEAQADVLPADVPVVLAEIGLLLGRLIVRSGSANAVLVESAFANTFGTSIINNHNNLAGLRGGLDYYHLTTAEYNGTGTGVFVKAIGPTITNATISGSLYGTASYVAIAQTASYVVTAQTASYVVIAQTASYVATASYVGAATFITTAQTASFVRLAESASFVATASYVGAATFITTAQTASYVQAANVEGTITSASYALTASVALNASVPTNVPSASWVSASAFITTAQTASYVAAPNIDGTVISASYAVSSSYVPNLYPQVAQVTVPSASWVSASVKITTADTASYIAAANVVGTFTATQAPIAFSASWVSASAFITTAQTASYVAVANIEGTVSTASYAFTASVALNASIPTSVPSASWVSASAFITTAQTASYVLAANISGKVSTASTADTASYVLAANVVGTVTSASYALSASYYPAVAPITVPSASWVSASAFITTAQTASYVTASNVIGIVATALSASWASSSISSSFSTTASYVATIFSRGGTIYDPLGIAGTAATSQSIVIWRAPFACTVTNVLGQRITGSRAFVNAWRTSGTVSGSIAASNIDLNTASLWMSASSLNAASTSFSIGDELDIVLVSSSAYPTQIAIQVDFTK